MISNYLHPSALVFIFNNLRREMCQSKDEYISDLSTLGENESFREGEVKPVGCGGHRVGS